METTKTESPKTEKAPKVKGPGLLQGASPKLSFIFGMISGIAIAAVVGIVLFLIFGYEKDGSAKVNANSNTNSVTYTNVAKVSSSDYIRGDKNAKVTLVLYSDLECPYCKTFHTTLNKILDEYSGKVRAVFRNFPLSFHENAEKEAEAALCVGKLGGATKYWSFIDKIYERTKSNGTGFALTDLPALAAEVGVNKTKFNTCLDGNEMADRVSSEEADGAQGGATGTPTTFIVDSSGDTITALPGAYTETQVKTVLDQIL